MKKILIIDDEKNVHYSFKRIFPELEIESALSGEEALGILKERQDFSLIISDIKMSGISGLELLEKLKIQKINTPVIIITAHGTLDNAVNAVKKGAYDYLIKPFDLQKLKTVIYNALNIGESQGGEKHDKSEIKELFLVGKSLIMQDIYKEIARVALKDVTVLITGESGTGKELVARAIHHYSLRKEKPFVAVNCGAIPSELMESELFGYEKGAFTGAAKKNIGKFQQAENGTLFLDEIGDLPLNLQVKILRALQEMEIAPLGAEKTQKINVRIIAATNRGLKEEIKKRNFREDLYYRLNVVQIHLPPLRQRTEDIPHLIQHFIENVNFHHKMKMKGITEPALEKLMSYDFPGNVRELENIITRAAIHCHSDWIEKDDVQIDSSDEFFLSRMEKNLEGWIKILLEKDIPVHHYLEKTLLSTLLKKFDSNQSKMADYLEINRNTLRKKLKDYHIL